MSLPQNTTGGQTTNSLTIALATIGTTYIIRHVGLDPSLYGVLYPGICYAIDNFQYNSFKDFAILKYLTFWNVCIILIIYNGYKYYSDIMGYINDYFKRDPDYNYVDLYIPTQINTFNKYVKHFEHFYDSKLDMQYGDPELILKTNLKNSGFDSSNYFENMATYKKVINDKKINFKDTNFDVEGYYMWQCNSVTTKTNNGGKDEANKDVTLKYPYITIYIKKKTGKDNKNEQMNVNKYLNNISKKVDEIECNDIKLWHVKILRDRENIKHNHMVMYAGKKKALNELEKMYIEPFFHKDKEIIWKTVKEIQFKPDTFFKLGQAPRVGLLLYGPPGTGKSSLVYKIAMALDRHVISMDLRSIKSRHDIYRFMGRPEVAGYYGEPKDVVFVFDEFDLTVQELHAKKKKNDNGYARWNNYINHMENDFVDIKIGGMKSDDDVKSKESKDEKTSKDSNCTRNSSYHLDSYLDSPNELTLEDLLEIFQGPVPLNGSIIIATTNKYEEIKELCPALFRPGRLTPILFDNIDNKVLSQMVKYYYNKDYIFEGDIYKYALCPSYIIQIITESKLCMLEDEYGYFIRKLEEKIKEIDNKKNIENAEKTSSDSETNEQKDV